GGNALGRGLGLERGEGEGTAGGGEGGGHQASHNPLHGRNRDAHQAPGRHGRPLRLAMMALSARDMSNSRETPQAIRGTQDIFGADAEAFAHVVETFERVRKLYRFRRVEMPVFEKT